MKAKRRKVKRARGRSSARRASKPAPAITPPLIRKLADSLFAAGPAFELPEWHYDAPSGTFKNPVLSERVRAIAYDTSEFLPHAHFIALAPPARHLTLNVIREASDVTAPLCELRPLPELSFSEVILRASEYGTAIPYIRPLETITSKDLTSVEVRTLIEQLRLTINAVVARAFKTAPTKYIPLGLRSSSWSALYPRRVVTDGCLTEPRFSGRLGRIAEYLGLNQRPILATRGLVLADLDNLIDMLQERGVPKIDGDHYVLIARASSLSDIRRSIQFVPSMVLARRYPKEIGTYGCVRIIQTHHNALLGKVGVNGCLGEAVIFGADAVSGVTALEPELRAALPSDFGRTKSIAIYGIYGAAPTCPGNIIHVTSAPVPPTLRERAVTLGRRLKSAPYRVAHKARYRLAVYAAGGRTDRDGRDVHETTFGHDRYDCPMCWRNA